MAVLTGSLTTVTAGLDTGYSNATIKVARNVLSGELVEHVSTELTGFTDPLGIPLDLPVSLCNLTGVPNTSGQVVSITYTFSCGVGIPAYSADTVPATIKSIPRGSSDLIVPSTVTTSISFPTNTISNQVFSYVGPSLTSVTANFRITVNEYNSSGTYLRTASVTFTQTVSRPAYRGFNSLDLKQYR